MLTRSDAGGAAAAAALVGGDVPAPDDDFGGWRSLWGANAELRTDARRVLRCRRVAPLSVSGSAVVDESGELVAAVAAGLRVVTGPRTGVGAKVQVNSRGYCNASLQIRSHTSTRLGLLGLYPLGTLLWDMAGAGLERRRARRRAERQRRQQARKEQQRALGDGGGGDGGGGGERV
ncbi:hypothetical protein MNEG_13051 [Monoraphidium neglectum]|uniref:Uncharacterized protein n=1 Tax=Monoraphidium neglectum TaxID=145388 RepID=A0A0D2KGC7_9CHLO|nr:hypothetical protein MNEG_13051 [Monoraphidium neglectum]KIY94908.1 hypothetical protein MNEG_13051 [Monoraphidium neglectum]|eukprot:XP_013893928.1 hypothetical protein MNEG_13051 [Monoraphidium neglectum]